MGSFTNKVILITGATSGIGRALALQIAGNGVNLILTSRHKESLIAVEDACREKGAECSGLQVDMAEPDSIQAFVNEVITRFGKLDILVNNAGISQRSVAEETSLEVDRKIMQVNFFGPVQLTKSLWPLLSKSAHANIVLMSSVVGTFGFPQRSAYSASKHALEGFFESWMIENSHSNIHFTTIAPGRIRTNISYSALKGDGSAHQQMDPGLAVGISAEKCAKKIADAIINNKRKVYIAQREMILIFLRKYVPFIYFRIVKKIKPV